jgi:hypothetical protein
MATGITVDEMALLWTKLMKKFALQVGKIKADRPKLYGLILEHMSVESRDEGYQDMNYEVWHNAMDLEKVWQTIIKPHKVVCVSNVTQVKELTSQKSYHKI